MKRVRMEETRTARNRAIKSAVKTCVKNVETATDREAAARIAVKKIDQAAAKGVIHKNTAARKKSSLARSLNAK